MTQGILSNEVAQVIRLCAMKKDGTPDVGSVLHRFPVGERSISIEQASLKDEVEIPGRSGKVKQAIGYEDAVVRVGLLLLDDDDLTDGKTAMQKYEDLQRAFRDRGDAVTDEQSQVTLSQDVPLVFAIQSPLTDACGIKTVLFDSLSVDAVEGATDLEVTISLLEFEPTSTQIERRNKENAVLAETQAEVDSLTKATQEHNRETGEESDLEQAFRQGKASAMGEEPPLEDVE